MAKKDAPETTEAQAPPVLFITGGSQGVGLWVARAALKAGYKVLAATTEGTAGAVRIRAMGALPVYPDLTRAGELKSVMTIATPDVVVNCDPQSLVSVPQHRVDYHALAQKVRASTETLAQVSAELDVPTLVHLSAGYLYGETGAQAIDETGAIDTGNDVYSALQAAEAAVQEADLTAYILRTGYLYSGESHALQALAEKLRAGQGVIDGKGHANYVHESDLAQAIMHLIDPETATEAGVYNVATDQHLTHHDFLLTFGELFGVGQPSGIPSFMERFRIDPFQKTLVGQSTVLDNSKLQATGWHAQYPTVTAGIEQALLIWRAAEGAKYDSESKELTTT